MTHEEIIQIESYVPKRCRGYLPRKARLLKKVYFKERNLKQASRIDMWNRGRSDDELIIIDVVGEGVKMAVLENGSQEPLRYREPCNYNFNLTILSGPFDGKLHTYTCPRCFVEGEYTAPLEDTWNS